MTESNIKSRNMKEQRVAAGAMIFHEGAVGDAVYILEQGEVEILRGSGDDSLRLAVLRKGAIFGEMAVLRDKPRSTGVRALTDCTMIVLAKADFLEAFGAGSSLALPLLRMLCERLSAADDIIAQQQLLVDTVAPDEIKQIRLLPASNEMAAQIGSDGLVLEKLPFRIGCHAVRGHGTSASPRALLLRHPGNLQVSPEHLSIEYRDNALTLRDLGSHLGTTLNNSHIAHFEHRAEAPLRLGSNDLQLGSLESPYRFRLLVEVASG
jgi:CRP-like cAMP-binding protein